MQNMWPAVLPAKSNWLNSASRSRTINTVCICDAAPHPDTFHPGLHQHYPLPAETIVRSNIMWNPSIPQAGKWQAWLWHCQERMIPNIALHSKMCWSSEWLHLAPSAVSLKDHTSMLCLPGLLSARSDSCNLRTSQKEVKLVGQLILWISLLWLGQVGLCLARA